MYKITTQERLIQNLVNEYEKFADPRLVPLFRRTGVSYRSLHVHEKSEN